MSSTKPHIVLIYHDADMVTLRTFEALAERGFTITLAAPAGLDIDTTLPRHDIVPIKGKLNFKAIRSLRAALGALAPAAIYAVSTSALSTALWASRGKSVRVIGYRGTQARVHRLDPTYRMALLNPRVDHIVCETADIEQYLSRYISPTRLSWRPKPYSTDWVRDAIEHPIHTAAADHDTFSIVYIGITAGRPHKGLHYLLEAMTLLERQRPDIKARLTVVGQADDKDIASAPGCVTFTGNRRDAIHFLPGADALVLPSTRDASPRVVREAQACGVPCIVSDIPGARDLIIADSPGQSGLLVPPADPEAIARAIASLHDNPETHLKMCSNATDNITLNYRPEAYTDYMEGVLLGVTGHNS